MKYFNDEIFVVGTAEEIKAVEKSMRRAWREERSNIWPSHGDAPLYNTGRFYGLAIVQEQYHDTYYVVAEHYILKRLVLEEP